MQVTVQIADVMVGLQFEQLPSATRIAMAARPVADKPAWMRDEIWAAARAKGWIHRGPPISKRKARPGILTTTNGRGKVWECELSDLGKAALREWTAQFGAPAV